MTYQEAIDFLYSSLPMYQRVGKAAYKANLDNTLRLDAALNHPHLMFPNVHVAGTNGKGSVSHMLASILQESGYRTGLYTSPHLLDFRERIQVNGQPIPEEEVTGFIMQHGPIINDILPSFFEMTVAMAFDYFARQRVDVAIIETGLGGRLDSTNIITPVLSIITNISMDHMEFLGNDLVSIAQEKGGIIKEQVPLVVGKANHEVEQVLRGMAEHKRAPFVPAYRIFEPSFQTYSPDGTAMIRIKKIEQDARESTFLEWRSTEIIRCDLSGQYQQENVVTSLTAIGQLRDLGWSIPKEAMERGFVSVVKNTRLLGRWQQLGNNPRSICDTAHNQEGITAVMNQLVQVPFKRLHMVWGMVSDKDPDAILPLLPRRARYYFTRSGVPRSMDPIQLQSSALLHGLRGECYPSVEKAYQAALQHAEPEDLIFTGGSTFVVADLLKASGY